MELVNYQEQCLSHVQVELFFNVLQCPHWHVLVTEQGSEHLGVEDTFTCTWYTLQNPSSHCFLLGLEDICQPVSEVLDLEALPAKDVRHQLIDQRTGLCDLMCVTHA